MEFLVEPFRENDPGPHVVAAVDAATAAGLEVEMGPFATSASGPLEAVLAGAAAVQRVAFEAGATAVQLQIHRIGEVR